MAKFVKDNRYLAEAECVITVALWHESSDEDPAFKKYGVDEIKVLCKQFQFEKDRTLVQWYNFNYLMSSWKVPSAVLRGKDDPSPTEFTRRKVVAPAGFWPQGSTLEAPACIHIRNFKNVKM